MIILATLLASFLLGYVSFPHARPIILHAPESLESPEVTVYERVTASERDSVHDYPTPAALRE